eukprot:CCRYP_019390-RA/>CCRYP_019390-RA protein AED:0.52 eAED:0.46 QI:0/-1/0/1/-1/1/1/0/174
MATHHVHSHCGQLWCGMHRPSTGPITWTTSSSSTTTTKSLKTGKAIYTQALNLPGTIPHAPADSPWEICCNPPLQVYNHPLPKKHQLSPFKATPIIYGAKTQFIPDPDDSPPLSAADVKPLQDIVSALLYYAHAVDNKLLHALSDIGTEQESATCRTNEKSPSSWTTQLLTPMT